MAEKDVTQKILEAKPDVFADIVNGFLFNGDSVIKPEELKLSFSISSYEDKGKFRSLERDVSMIWQNNKINIACIGIENQSSKDKSMPLRVIAYDGAEYKKQINDNVDNYYPVITLVLYYGADLWENYQALSDLMHVPNNLKPYFNDYKINLFDLAHMSIVDAKKFTSDFGAIVDYFAQINETKDYNPSTKILDYPEETLRLMKYLTKDAKYEQLLSYEKGGQVSMYDYLQVLSDKAEARGEARGEAIGEARGKELYAKLTKKLIQLGRTNDLLLAADDTSYREALMKELAIQ